MTYYYKITVVIFSFFLLNACYNKMDNDKWLLTNTLNYNNQPINWESEKVVYCSRCRIETQRVYQPTGVNVYTTVFQGNSWRAVHAQSPVNVIRLKLPTQSPYLYVEALGDEQIVLFNAKQRYTVKIGEVVEVTFNGDTFSILINNFIPIDTINTALPRRATLEYIALKKSTL